MLKIHLTFVLSVATTWMVHAQQVFESSEIDRASKLDNQTSSVPNSQQKTSVIPCDPGHFWVIDGLSQDVYEFLLTGTVVTNLGVVVSGSSVPANLGSLGVGMDPSGVIPGPTFFSSAASTAYLYDGTTWIPYANDSICGPINAGAADTMIYYQKPNPSCISRLTSSGFQPFYSTGIATMSVADLAVDEAGNVWFTEGFYPGNQFITIVNPAGTIIKQYAVSVHTTNAYGCMLMNGVYYLAFGASSPYYPNSLIPYYITQDSAIAGNPIAMPVVSNVLADMASCVPGNPLGVHSVSDVPVMASVFPNPASDGVWIKLNRPVQGAISISLSDVTGRIALQQVVAAPDTTGSIRLEVSHLPRGIFLITIITSLGTCTQKLQIQ